MANSITYEVITSSTPVRNRPNHNAKILGYLYQGNTLEVISINNQWAYFKFNKKNAYIDISDIQLVEQVPITGNLTIEYIDADSQLEIQDSKTYTNLELKSYTYTATEINGYKVYGDTTKTITLTSDNPNQTITFYYEEILGSINIKYIDSKTSQEISTSETYDNLPLLGYTYTAKEINYYEIVEPKTKSVILTEADPNQTITFSYKKIVGDIIIKYINSNTGESILSDEVYNNLSFGSYNYTAKEIDNYTLISENNVVVDLSDSNPTRTIIFEYKVNIFVIDLEEYNISNKNTNATATTKGINQALVDAKSKGYNKVELPAGHYAIDTSVSTTITMTDGTKSWKQNAKGIIVPSGIELILTGCTLQMIPTNDPYYSVISISNTNNTKITGGTILGDRDTHDYGHRINNTKTELESGSFDNSTGLAIANDTMVRTKNYIDNFNGNTLPNEFYIIPLENTTKNTVDGGVRYIYCYDSNNNYLGIATGSNGFISKATLLPNTAKIKISFKDEKRLDAKYFISNNMTYFTHEFGNGINITASNNTTIDGTTIKDMIGDCITTFAPPVNVTVDNLKILNCTLENSRRQGISFVATGENYLVQGCNIGNINGVDPQAGIDIENYNYIRNIVIDKSNFYNNRKLDIINYNGNDIEIKNSNFDGTIGSTYSWNMNIHDNEMIFKNSSDNPKLHNATFILNTNKTDDNNAYFKIDNNIIKDYPSGGSIANLALSEFTNNKVYNTKELNISSTTHSNYFENSSLWYSSNTVTNEIFNNSTISIKHTNLNPNFNNCQFNNSLYRPALTSTSTIKDSTIINNSRSFGDTSAWWDLRNTIVFDNCDITTKYTSNIPFLNNHASNTFFRYCRLNLSRYTFCVNYGGIEFDNCDISFNNLNTDSNIVDFDRMGYYNETNYWKFDNCTISSDMPLKINTTNLNNNIFVGDITHK